MSSYLINGEQASIAPATIWWQPNPVGTDHNGAPIYSKFYNVLLEFDACTPAEASQWLNAASVGGSVSLTFPNRWSAASFVTFSPVYMNLTEPPNYETINMAPFRITVSRVIPE